MHLKLTEPISCCQLMDALNAGLLIVGKNGRIVGANRFAAELLHRSEEELKEREIGEVLLPFEKLVSAPKEQNLELLLPSGDKEAVSLSVSFLPGNRGHDSGHYVCLFHSITSVVELRKQANRLLQLAAVSETLPSILHEVRNPLAAINSMVELMLEETTQQNLREDLHNIYHEVRRIQLTLQGIGAVGSALRTNKFNAIDHHIEQIVQLLQPMADRAGVKLKSRLQALPLLKFDGSVIRAIVLNLVNNSIAASPPGSEIVVSLSMANQKLELVVEDQGRGMSPEVVERCTELFFSTKEHGSGIGLALCKQIVEAAGGSLQIRSALERGTTVKVILSAA